MRIERIVCGIGAGGAGIAAAARAPPASRPTARPSSWWARPTTGPRPCPSRWAATSTWAPCRSGRWPRSTTSRRRCAPSWSGPPRPWATARTWRRGSRWARWRRPSRAAPATPRGCCSPSTPPWRGACSGSSTATRAPGCCTSRRAPSCSRAAPRTPADFPRVVVAGVDGSPSSAVAAEAAGEIAARRGSELRLVVARGRGVDHHAVERLRARLPAHELVEDSRSPVHALTGAGGDLVVVGQPRPLGAARAGERQRAGRPRRAGVGARRPLGPRGRHGSPPARRPGVEGEPDSP